MTFRPNTDLVVSVLAHLMVLVLIFLFSEVHQFDQVAADTVPVDIVTPQEMAETTPEPTPSPTPTPQLELPSLDTPPTPEAAAKASVPQPPAEPAQKQPAQKEPAQKQAAQKQAPQPSPSPQPAAKAEPPPAQQPRPETPQQPPPQQQAYLQPQPDLSLKYGVILGLPPALPAAPSGPHSAGEGGADDFDAPATEEAKVGSSVVTEFRRHLKTCLKLPGTVSSGDDVRVKLRVLMTPDGKLAAPPQLIEATASEKGPLLIQSATSALKACQPYTMLPRDRYGEWKVLDLDFTPRDFAS